MKTGAIPSCLRSPHFTALAALRGCSLSHSDGRASSQKWRLEVCTPLMACTIHAGYDSGLSRVFSLSVIRWIDDCLMRHVGNDRSRHNVTDVMPHKASHSLGEGRCHILAGADADAPTASCQ